ncbi:efflux RND transporter periplasmic adaptor subunit [Gluconacetobacter diazotrophicus]|uniref:Efflux RND transporter periplasmic adaptor subunit n=2 Tax=Gluconacetobacter diazotrophicus TaxID=33996 RepID=A0A7W4I4X8_GLUDI|nr:efflux RND transporter periplasmic adaptor subunit [Gluconacetobacter diazotrophicus]MBB2156437.1 efflux RND transporter periplasmic adaptor subunit [Gluconacetobacter diazotrophicus]TWB06091.1 RND family efflux transporter MFP subunit [Gluconacetobacter diazotrophicus]CAP57360.1 putative transporter protein [Gluconacetobacter diazotrophicus PA1 5]
MSADKRLSPSGSDGRGSRKVLWLVACVAVVLAAVGIVQRRLHYVHLQGQTTEASIPDVQMTDVLPGPATRDLTLPANIEAWYEAPIYAQVSGYVKMWYTDFGAVVKQGDVLAEINTPSLDAEYHAAQANLNVELAKYKLAVITADRWKALQGTQAVAQQEVSVQVANAAAQEARVDAARHAVDRYEALEGFKKIVAPFDGIVTNRFVNVGAYVNAGRGDVTAQGGAAELFSVADVHAMRVFVSVPQDYASVISPKLKVSLSVPQFPGRKFTAKYLTTAAAFNASTRTVTTELTVDNPDRLLWPNSYASAFMQAPGNPDLAIIPESALIFRAQGTQVATVDSGGYAHLVSVTVGNNLGNAVEVLSGVHKGERIIDNPSAGLLEGQKVRIVPPTLGYNVQPQPHAEGTNDNARAMPEEGSAPSEDRK